MKPIIRVENLSKQYVIGGRQEPYATFRESLVNAARLPLNMIKRRPKENTDHRFWALKDVSFEVKPGEVVGIIGRNGAGKSTLLKILSRITEPTVGRIELYGRVGSLLEVGTGFHPELTGRENIYLNGAILGMRREEIAKKFDEIVDFAEIEDFLDTPVKRYSSGMYTRLAFAVAANLEPEILIVDEVLAVGDAEFQKKCLGKMKSVSDNEGRTILFVSHNMSAVKTICRRGIMLKGGSLQFDGDAVSAVDFYMQGGSDLQSSRDWANSAEMPGNENIKIRRASVRAADKSADEPILTSDDLVFEVEFYNDKNGAEIDVTWDLMNVQGIHIAHIGTICASDGLSRGWHKTTGILPRDILNTERYIFSVQFGRNQRELLFRMEEILTFDVEDGIKTRANNFSRLPGVIHPMCQWQTTIAENEPATILR
ncbi:MAG TPA: ABC transporter ATP-binding protein [Pyrinomonadaceae bacterium]|jgi:lipopolysaccharide transport system ATP-binding protein